MLLKKFLYKVTHWETWHYLAKYLPLAPVWFWYCLRARSLWFFTPSNPALTFGGFEGEEKREMYELLPAGTYPRTIYISPSFSFKEVEEHTITNSFTYPFAVKPNVGMMGLLFRKIENKEQLKRYHQTAPATYLIQKFVAYPLEISVFYYRFPTKQKGIITGFIRKEFLEVTGDGRSTLLQLMLHYPRVTFRLPEMKAKHLHRLNSIIPKGERFCLSPALNLSRGGKLVSLAHENDERLLKVFDDLNHRTKGLYYGRYDIKCLSIEDLKRGENFSILEFNGCGAEPHHIYGNGNNLFQAYKIVLHHWNVLYKISAQNHKNGASFWKYKDGCNYIKKARQHFKLLKRLDREIEL